MRPRRASPRSRTAVPPPRGAAERQAIWARAQKFIKRAWVVIIAVCSAIGAMTKYVQSVDAERETRRARISGWISGLRRDSLTIVHIRSLDSLDMFGIAEHLEPLAIRGLVYFVRGNTRSKLPCAGFNAPQNLSGLPPSGDIDRALQLIRKFQAGGRRYHPYPDRIIDAFLAVWRGEPDATGKPFDFDSTDLRGANLRGLDLRSVSFLGACLVNANFDSAQLGSATFRRAHLDGASFMWAQLDSAALDTTTVDSARFEHATMRYSQLEDARGMGVRFDHADLMGATMIGAHFPRARLFGANLSCALLGNAHLDSAYFSSAIASWTFLGGASLFGADKWSEIVDFRGAFIASSRGLAVSLVALAHARGAVPDSTDQAAWQQLRIAQFRKGSLCAPRG